MKDFLAALRLSINSRDEVAWYRLLRLHDGIGPARAARLLPLLLGGDADATETADAPRDLDAWRNQVVAAAPAAARTGLDATLRQLNAAQGQAAISVAVAACTAMVVPLVHRRYSRRRSPRRRSRAALRSSGKIRRSRGIRRAGHA